MIVGAVVVRRNAFITGEAANWRSSSGENSHRLPTAMRMPNGISGPMCASMSADNPSIAPGIWWSCRRAMASLMMPMAVSRGGCDECPPSTFTVNLTVM